MFNIQKSFAFAAFAALILIAAAPIADAQKKGGGGGGKGGGGGGGSDAPAGIIYYTGPQEGATHPSTAQTTSMSPDGTNVTRYAIGCQGEPSYITYNGHRWFIRTLNIADELYPDGTNRREVFALRADWHSTNNDTPESKVQLTDNINLEPGAVRWVPGGTEISFSGDQWVGGTKVDKAIFTASLAIGTDGNITGLVAQPTTPFLYTAWGGAYSWAPTGDKIIYGKSGTGGLWVVDQPNGPHQIYSGSAQKPQWSPDGSKIAYSNGSGVYTIKTNGKGRKQIISNTSTMAFFNPYWDPTGSFIVCTGQDETTLPGNVDHDLYRATASGGELTNLTNTVLPEREFIHPTYGGGWR